MKINLAAEDHDIKDNDPPGYFDTYFKGSENKTEKQEECINDYGAIPKYHQRSFQPGKRDSLVYCSGRLTVCFYIAQPHGYKETDIAQHGDL